MNGDRCGISFFPLHLFQQKTNPMQTELYVHYLKELNWLAVAASALAYFFLGAVWYSPVLFSKTWVRLSGV